MQSKVAFQAHVHALQHRWGCRKAFLLALATRRQSHKDESLSIAQLSVSRYTWTPHPHIIASSPTILDSSSLFNDYCPFWQYSILFLFLFALYPYTSASITNLTLLNTEIVPSWAAQPSGCGTWDLVYSCLFTLLLYFYTAIHPNIPDQRHSQFCFWLIWNIW